MELVKIGKVKGNESNPRFIKEDKFEKLVKSIKDFPEMLKLRPIVVNKDMTVLGGNMRLKACVEAGLKEVYILKAEGLTKEQEDEFIVKDNLGFGEWDWDVLANEWDSVQLEEWGLEGFPFEDIELDAVEDDYSEPDSIKVDVVLGDLIEIGEHRLLCGDSTSIDNLDLLRDGNTLDMVFTDPPYGMDYQLNITKTKLDKIEGDSQPFKILDVWATILDVPIKYFCTRFDKYVLWQNEISESVKNIIVWKKSNMGAGDLSNYGYQHEFIMYWGNSINGKRDTNIWEEGNTPKAQYVGHPTQKPVSLVSRAINNHNVKLIYDAFLGSGTTMVAAHQLKRKCYGMELDPKYCQVIIDRMMKLDDSLKVKINGKKYSPTK